MVSAVLIEVLSVSDGPRPRGSLNGTSCALGRKALSECQFKTPVKSEF